ncbi:putative matrin-3 [Scophthalmus maximus]|uniref:Putative matrin-3 n=1 Tax=Scophthalmus maximus TaxID=52904 RepID=A0A2U9C4S0_SCOMX|nr:putative matrin-3 [Scophthalmus maximus]
MVDFRHRPGPSDYGKTGRTLTTGPVSSRDRPADRSAGRGERTCPTRLSASGLAGYRPRAPPAEEYRPKPRGRRPESEQSSIRSGRASVPSRPEALDFHGTPPQVFPYSCSLCDITVLSEQVWIKHINGSHHADGQLGLLQRFPNWDCRMETVVRSDDQSEKRKDEENPARPPQEANENPRPNKQPKRKTSEKGKVVCVKFPAQSVDEAFLRKLTEPFGKIVKILMFPSLAFVELGSVDQAKDLVKFHVNCPPTVNGEQMEFSVSNTFSFLQLHSGSVGRRRPIRSHRCGQALRPPALHAVPSVHDIVCFCFQAFVEMKNVPDAQKLVDYYSSNTLRINSDIFKVSFSGEHRSLMRVAAAQRYEEEEAPSSKRGRSHSQEPDGKTETERRRSGSREKRSRSRDKSSSRDKCNREKRTGSREKRTRSRSRDKRSSADESDIEGMEAPPTRVVYITNLPSRFYSDASFVKLVRGFGTAVRYFLIRRQSQGFIEMSTSSEALRAARQLNCESFHGSRLAVNISHKYNRLSNGYEVQPDSDGEKRSERRSKSRTSDRKSEGRKESLKKTPEKESGSRKSSEKESGSRKSSERESRSRKSSEKESGSRKNTGVNAGSRKTPEKESGSRKSNDKESASRKTPEKESGSRKTPQVESKFRNSTETESGSGKSTEKESGSRKSTEKDPQRKSLDPESPQRKSRDPKSPQRKSLDPESPQRKNKESSSKNTDGKNSAAAARTGSEDETLKRKGVSDDDSVPKKTLKIESEKEASADQTEEQTQQKPAADDDDRLLDCGDAVKLEQEAEHVGGAAEPEKPTKPVGTNFVRPVVGYFCNLCQLIYADEDEAKLQHCSSLPHYRKYQEKTGIDPWTS